MRNLKKILALALALVMTLSLMTVANASSFNDDSQIDETYAEAVDVLSALGVFRGVNDGSNFAPKQNITRASVAAIIYRIVTGDVDDTQAGLYKDYAKFDDVPEEAWYAGYVGYCANAELVVGNGAGSFLPDDEVTGYQALAMILRAVGYDQNGEFQGTGWEIRVASTAQSLGILKNVNQGTLNTAASREVVAELLFQAIQVPTVTYTPALNYNQYKDLTNRVLNESIGYKTFGLVRIEGVVTANEYAQLEKTTSVAALAAGRTHLADAEISDNNVQRSTDIYAITTNVDVIGQNVYFYALQTTVRANIYTYTAITEATAIGNNVVDYSNTEAPRILNTNSATEYYNNYGVTTADKLNTGKGVMVKAIDNDGDGVVEYVLSELDTLAEVEYIGSNGTVYLNEVTSAATQVTYNGIAVGDVVLTITYGGRTYMELASYVTGNISSYVHSSTATNTATINGTAYEVSDITYGVVNGTTSIFNSVRDTFANQYNGRTYDYFLDAYGNIRAYALSGENETTYGLVLAYDRYQTGAFSGDWYVRYLTTDNTVETKVVADESSWWVGEVGTVVKYRVNSADEFVAVYNITDADANDTVTTRASDMKAVIDWSDNTADTTYNIDNNFIAFYYVDAGVGYTARYGVLTGAAAIADLAAGKELAQYDAVSGVDTHTNRYETLAVVNIDDVIDASAQYCYIFTDTHYAAYTTEDGQRIYSYDAVNAAGEPIEVYTTRWLYNSDMPVWSYVTETVNVVSASGNTTTVVLNWLELAATDTVSVGVGDLHADQTSANHFRFYGPTSQLGMQLAGTTFADVTSTAGGTTTLSATYCASGYVVYTGRSALAVFVEETVADYPTYVDVSVKVGNAAAEALHLKVGSTLNVGAEYAGGTYTWTSRNGTDYSGTVSNTGDITIVSTMAGATVTVTAREVTVYEDLITSLIDFDNRETVVYNGNGDAYKTIALAVANVKPVDRGTADSVQLMLSDDASSVKYRNFTTTAEINVNEITQEIVNTGEIELANPGQYTVVAITVNGNTWYAVFQVV